MAGPLKPVPGVARVSFNHAYTTTQAANIFHVSGYTDPVTRDVRPWTQTQLDALTAALRTAWVTNMLPLMGNVVVLRDVIAIDLTSIEGLASLNTGTNPGSLAVSSALPQNVAAVISWKIHRRFRGGHPRTYLAGQGLAQMSNQTTWDAAHVTNLTTKATAFHTAVKAISGVREAAPIDLCCVHRVWQKVDLDPPVVSKIQGLTVDSRIDSQRRRLGRDR